MHLFFTVIFWSKKKKLEHHTKTISTSLKINLFKLSWFCILSYAKKVKHKKYTHGHSIYLVVWKLFFSSFSVCRWKGESRLFSACQTNLQYNDKMIDLSFKKQYSLKSFRIFHISENNGFLSFNAFACQKKYMYFMRFPCQLKTFSSYYAHICTVGRNKKTKHPYLFQSKLSYRN